MAFKDNFKHFQALRVNDELQLRQVDPEKDLEDYYSIYSDTEAFDFYEGALKTKPDAATVKVILANQIKAFEKAREYTWTIADARSGRALGRIHLSGFEGGNKIANIGYFIRRDAWGKGVISSCIKPVAEFGFSALCLERIYTTVHPDNIASWKALEKNGFAREGLLRHCFNLSTGLADCYMYARLFTD